MANSIVDQRMVIYTAYVAQLDDPEYILFSSRDIAYMLDVPVINVAAIIHKCVRSRLISKVGREKSADIFSLTKDGMNRGLYYAENYNPITRTLRK